MKITELKDDGQLLVNGKPFFPIIMFSVRDSREMWEVRKMGFNATFHGPNERHKRANLMALADEGAKMPETHWLLNYLIDEPEGAVGKDGKTPYPPAWVDKKARESKEKWPDLPTGVMLYDILNPKEICRPYLETSVDVILTDPYPLLQGWSIQSIEKQIAYIHRYTEKPVWVILQAWTARDRQGEWLPMPTPKQNQEAIQIALESGAKGIGWFGYRFFDSVADDYVLTKDIYPKLWANITDCIEALRQDT